ncbi:MAG: AmmeMemoRadiSam system protein A [Pseudomonadota bacterium]
MNATDLTPRQRRQLLRVARRAVQQAVGAPTDRASTADLPEDFTSHGAFVTLHHDGMLRGCIGTFAPSPSILGTIREMAEAAALRDPRFRPLQAGDVEHIDIEISLLTPLEPVKNIAVVEVGRHGLCISHNHHRGVLLPQVATEHHWNRETFLDQTCIKAGLAPGTWQDPDCHIEVFEAVVVGEHDAELRVE